MPLPRQTQLMINALRQSPGGLGRQVYKTFVGLPHAVGGVQRGYMQGQGQRGLSLARGLRSGQLNPEQREIAQGMFMGATGMTAPIGGGTFPTKGGSVYKSPVGKSPAPVFRSGASKAQKVGALNQMMGGGEFARKPKEAAEFFKEIFSNAVVKFLRGR